MSAPGTEGRAQPRAGTEYVADWVSRTHMPPPLSAASQAAVHARETESQWTPRDFAAADVRHRAVPPHESADRDILVMQLERELQRVIAAMTVEKTAQGERVAELAHEARVARAQRDALAAADAAQQQALARLESDLAQAVSTLERERRAWTERAARLEHEATEARMAAEKANMAAVTRGEEIAALKRRLMAEERARVALQDELSEERASHAAAAEAQRRTTEETAVALRAAERAAESARDELERAIERAAALERQVASVTHERDELQAHAQAAEAAAAERLRTASARISEDWEVRMRHAAAEHEAALARAERAKDAAIAEADERSRRQLRAAEDRLSAAVRERDDALARLLSTGASLTARSERLASASRAAVDDAATLRDMLARQHEEASRAIARLSADLRALASEPTAVTAAPPSFSVASHPPSSQAPSVAGTPLRVPLSPSTGPFTDRAFSIARHSLSPQRDGSHAHAPSASFHAQSTSSLEQSSPVRVAHGRAAPPRVLFGPPAQRSQGDARLPRYDSESSLRVDDLEPRGGRVHAGAGRRTAAATAMGIAVRPQRLEKERTGERGHRGGAGGAGARGGARPPPASARGSWR